MFRFNDKNKKVVNGEETELIGAALKRKLMKKCEKSDANGATHIIKSNSKSEEYEMPYEQTQFVDRKELAQKSGKEIQLQERYNPEKVYHSILKDSLIIGRSIEDCNIAISHDRTVSSKQCKLLLEEGEVYVVDLKGTNITYVNDEPVEGKRSLKTGDILGFGKIDLILTILP